MRGRAETKQQAGYNLVEVLIAMALLGTVLIAVVSLFMIGQKNVYSGKQMTRAVSAGTVVMEDISAFDTTQLTNAFGLGGVTLETVARHGKSYPNSYIVTTDDLSNDPAGYMTRWKERMTQENFLNGRIAVLITPRNGGADAPVNTANIFRVKVFVEWNEALRERQVTLESVKVDRTQD
ncbi:MAG TPA: prepilin-type N-terminal cleavage/methylation domain-containing protein [Rhodothermales bacterium]|nr:prepilin-type N-terminal cleavage/methylation domain-containing protein [Rhodothermales bacterium]